ncbi:hypothetical protein BDN67DRAFT_991113 [Paxillus ammoniavirescens]|nr:hypothetical protein BDN67DRAFT_991113 [Paxillus ammoniavirescens]
MVLQPVNILQNLMADDVYAYPHAILIFCLTSTTAPQQPPSPNPVVCTECRTKPDELGLFRVYPTQPTLLPKGETGLDAISDAPTFEKDDNLASAPSHVTPGLSQTEITSDNLYEAFSSPTAGLLMCYHYSGSTTKSAGELNRLWTFIEDPLFDSTMRPSFSHKREKKHIEKYLCNNTNPFRAEHGWCMSSVTVQLPKEKVKWDSAEDPDIPIIHIDSIHHCCITNIIVSVFQDSITSSFHMTPFEQYWKPSEDAEPVRVFSEAYLSPEFIDAYNEINSLPRDPDDNLEHVIASLMMWSDTMHLASFGDASLWPFYLYFGNQSKYTCGKPTASACHHVAYIPMLPDNFQDIYISFFDDASSDDMGSLGESSLDFSLTLRTIQKIDNDRCCSKVSQAREHIFKGGKGVNSKRVRDLLYSESLVPTRCAMPVFEGLLPLSHNKIVLDLIFDLTVWHAYAKLRLHTNNTLNFFNLATTALSQSLRKFQQKTCAEYTTTELPQEHAACGRHAAATAAKQGQDVPVSHSGPEKKELNLCTYKYHALGDYPDTIQRYGTTDSYSTQQGELEHCCSKRRFPRSGKKKDHMVGSIANQEAIERFVWKSAHQNDDITVWLRKRKGDPAVQDFIPRLKDHLLARLCGLTYDSDEYDFSDEDRKCVVITNNKMYHHSMFRVNYTTYDLQREQDTVNPLTCANIMVLSHEDERTHPYWYARVIQVFHVMVEYRKDMYSPFCEPTRMNVLFVCWFRRDTNFDAGWNAKRLHRLEFFDEDGLSDGFGFLDPDSVVRGIHLIPAFTYSATKDLLGPSFVRWQKGLVGWDDDWRYFYINSFVDRDMFMRLCGGGIGREATRDWDEFLQHEGRKPPNGSKTTHEDSDIEMDEGGEEAGDEVEEWEDIEEGEDSDGERDGNNDSDDEDEDSEDEDDIDRVMADDREELNDDILAAEGYGAL